MQIYGSNHGEKLFQNFLEFKLKSNYKTIKSKWRVPLKDFETVSFILYSFNLFKCVAH